MKYKEILRKNNIALLEDEAGTEYVVAVGYDPYAPENQQWGYGNYYPYWMNADKKLQPSLLHWNTFVTKRRSIISHVHGLKRLQRRLFTN